MKHLTRGTLDEAEIFSPPMLLQKEFAQRVTEIRELEAAQAAGLQRLEALFQSMLHRAFQGEI
jgi:type I restriction enzyme, S subunit